MPTVKYYYENGNIQKEIWYNSKNKYHRKNGPAIIEYNNDGKIISEKYYIKGNEIDELVILVSEN